MLQRKKTQRGVADTRSVRTQRRASERFHVHINNPLKSRQSCRSVRHQCRQPPATHALMPHRAPHPDGRRLLGPMSRRRWSGSITPAPRHQAPGPGSTSPSSTTPPVAASRWRSPSWRAKLPPRRNQALPKNAAPPLRCLLDKHSIKQSPSPRSRGSPWPPPE